MFCFVFNLLSGCCCCCYYYYYYYYYYHYTFFKQLQKKRRKKERKIIKYHKRKRNEALMLRLSLHTSFLWQTRHKLRLCPLLITEQFLPPEKSISLIFILLGQKNSWCVMLHRPSPDVSSFKRNQTIRRTTVLLLRLYRTFWCWIAVCDLFYELLDLPSFYIIFKGVTSSISNHMICESSRSLLVF